MQVRALVTFVDETGRHQPGDEFRMSDELAVVRLKAGLVRRVPESPLTATLAESEQAITRRGKR